MTGRETNMVAHPFKQPVHPLKLKGKKGRERKKRKDMQTSLKDGYILPDTVTSSMLNWREEEQRGRGGGE